MALLETKLRLIPLGPLQLGIGVLLLLFGALWLRKAVLRAAGALELHDEAKILARGAARSGARPRGVTSIDALGFIASLKGVFIEGVEVVFIVVSVVAAGGLLRAASLGALFAALAVILLGVALHRRLARVPENPLKFAVGVLLSSFGVFWIGEGAGLHWPADDWSILALIALSYWSRSSVSVSLRSLSPYDRERSDRGPIKTLNIGTCHDEPVLVSAENASGRLVPTNAEYSCVRAKHMQAVKTHSHERPSGLCSAGST